MSSLTTVKSSPEYDKFMQIANSVETSTDGDYSSAAKLLEDSSLDKGLVSTIKEIINAPLPAQMVARLIEKNIAVAFKGKDDRVNTQLGQIDTNLKKEARQTEFSQFARRNVTVDPKEAVPHIKKKSEDITLVSIHDEDDVNEATGIPVYTDERIDTACSGNNLMIFNYTGHPYVYGKYDEKGNGTQIVFPTLGNLTITYMDDSECIAILNPVISKHSQYRGQWCIEVLCLDYGKPEITHLYHYQNGKGREPFRTDKLEIPVSDTSLIGPSTKLLGFNEKEAAELFEGIQCYQTPELQLMRFTFNSVEKVAKLFPMQIARYIVAKSEAGKKAEAVLFKWKKERTFHLLEKSGPSTTQETASLFHFITGRANSSIGDWQFATWPKKYLKRQDLRNIAKEGGDPSISSAEAYHLHESTVRCSIVSGLLMSKPYEDAAAHSIAFTATNALIGETAQVIDQLAQKPSTDVLRCSLVNSSEKMRFVAGIINGDYSISSPAQNYRDSGDPVILFDTLGTPAIMSLAMQPDRKVSVGFTTIVNTPDVSGIPYSEDSRGEMESFSFSTTHSFRTNASDMTAEVDGRVIHGRRDIKVYPFGKGESSLPSVETLEGTVIYGRRMLPKLRITPLSGFYYELASRLARISHVFATREIAELVYHYLLEEEAGNKMITYNTATEHNPMMIVIPTDNQNS